MVGKTTKPMRVSAMNVTMALVMRTCDWGQYSMELHLFGLNPCLNAFMSCYAYSPIASSLLPLGLEYFGCFRNWRLLFSKVFTSFFFLYLKLDSVPLLFKGLALEWDRSLLRGINFDLTKSPNGDGVPMPSTCGSITCKRGISHEHQLRLSDWKQARVSIWEEFWRFLKYFYGSSML